MLGVIDWSDGYSSKFKNTLHTSGVIKVVVKRNSQKKVKRMAEHFEACMVLRGGKYVNKRTRMAVYPAWHTFLMGNMRIGLLKTRVTTHKYAVAEIHTCYYDSSRWVIADTRSIVPGDVVQLEEGMTLPCDGVIVSGSVVVDEAMLTGEAMPVQKTALQVRCGSPVFIRLWWWWWNVCTSVGLNALFPPVQNDNAVYAKFGSGKKHTLFAGTRTVQCQPAAGQDAARHVSYGYVSYCLPKYSFECTVSSAPSCLPTDRVHNVCFNDNCCFRFSRLVNG